MGFPGMAGMAREARAGRGKARRMAREMARRARNPVGMATKAASDAPILWLVGGLAAAGLGYVVWKGMQAPSATPAPTTPASPSPAPAVPPVVAPTPAAGGVTWTSSALPWAPPTNPANLTAGFGLADDLTTQDPMFVAMAQKALNMASLASGSTVSYSTAPNGIVDSSFQIALAAVQSALYVQIQQTKASLGGSYNPTMPHTNGTLDLKTLAFLIVSSAGIAVSSSGGLITMPTQITDPTLLQEASTALAAMIGLTPFASVTAGVTTPISSASLTQFQTNWNAAGNSFAIPVSGAVDWVNWAMLVTFAG